eukprot:scaffold1282_cov251-Pinguiococcus_pyrenoidosus.AAC.5
MPNRSCIARSAPPGLAASSAAPSSRPADAASALQRALPRVPPKNSPLHHKPPLCPGSPAACVAQPLSNACRKGGQLCVMTAYSPPRSERIKKPSLCHLECQAPDQPRWPSLGHSPCCDGAPVPQTALHLQLHVRTLPGVGPSRMELQSRERRGLAFSPIKPRCHDVQHVRCVSTQLPPLAPPVKMDAEVIFVRPDAAAAEIPRRRAEVAQSLASAKRSSIVAPLIQPGSLSSFRP